VCADTSAKRPGGVRLGTPAMTSRGMEERDMRRIGDLLHRIVGVSLRVQRAAVGECVLKGNLIIGGTTQFLHYYHYLN